MISNMIARATFCGVAMLLTTCLAPAAWATADIAPTDTPAGIVLPRPVLGSPPRAGQVKRGPTLAATLPPLELADVEVVTPPAQPAPPATPAPAPVQPVVAPVVTTPPVRTEVHHHEGSYMSTIAVNMFMGALAGGLVGTALYFAVDNRNHPQRIGYWAAGGVFVGGGVGIIQIAAQDRSETVSQSRLPSDPARTYRLALLNAHF